MKSRNDPDRCEPVYFFGTCLMDAVYPDAGMAAIRLLESRGVKVIFPPDQSCCGQPAYNSGFIREARAVARKQIEVFSKPYPIVVPSGSCAGMMKHHYPTLFAGTPDEVAARRFSERVYEWSEYLVTVLKANFEDRGAPLTITWHSSCHALREMDVIRHSKALLRQLKNVTLVELKRETECCGFGGTFAFKQPLISAAMVKDKIADIVHTGASTVVAGDCGCLMNITGAMEHAGVAIAGKHLAEFLWERTHAQ
ncbi:(Fe-S)-binding protein [uncultured Desulfosarcina sp.]|uniref:(Fe-S)-binding protein n=1 Tax=uncultured Desulfosarcina sp. TaxID=218289 RepID=UPI0029C87550|nr:(Fe-S)-binding protein [uncultured Desulfosarcina sp.]